ncbi:hypothetical protein GOP47_0030734 [Adiantum capillus-veneris]|nr:hypothetical protein GOP47_0030734 [Adiantum capillus-veneris]
MGTRGTGTTPALTSLCLKLFHDLSLDGLEEGLQAGLGATLRILILHYNTLRQHVGNRVREAEETSSFSQSSPNISPSYSAWRIFSRHAVNDGGALSVP